MTAAFILAVLVTASGVSWRLVRVEDAAPHRVDRGGPEMHTREPQVNNGPTGSSFEPDALCSACSCDVEFRDAYHGELI